MKTITVAVESRRVFADLKLNVKLGKKNIMPYLSGTQIKKTKMYKEVERYKKDAEIDYELGIIKKTCGDVTLQMESCIYDCDTYDFLSIAKKR